MLVISVLQLATGLFAWWQLQRDNLSAKFINWIFYCLFVAGALLWGGFTGLLESGVSIASDNGLWLFFVVVIMVMAIFRGGADLPVVVAGYVGDTLCRDAPCQ